jgi:CrcB protein
MPSLLHLGLVFVGAGIGGVARYALTLAMTAVTGTGFPWGTLVVNVTGSLLMGLCAHWISLRVGGGLEARLLIMTGLLGGFTTFSAFSLEAYALWERGAVAASLLYGIGSVALSIGALVVGLSVARAISPA